MDNHSSDGTQEIFLKTPGKTEKYYLVQPWDQSLKEQGVTKVADFLASGSSV